MAELALNDASSSIADTAERSRRLLLCCQECFTEELGRMAATQLNRFDLWAANIGVFSSRQASLDYRLRTAPTAKAAVGGNLEIICTNLLCALAGEDDLADEVLDEFAEAGPKEVARIGLRLYQQSSSATIDTRIWALELVEKTIGTLHQLSLAIRRASNRNSLVRVPHLRETDDSYFLVREREESGHTPGTHVQRVRFETTSGFDNYLRQILKVRWMRSDDDMNLDKREKDHRQLIFERCVSSISIRRRQLAYFHDHQAKLERQAIAKFVPKTQTPATHSTLLPLPDAAQLLLPLNSRESGIQQPSFEVVTSENLSETVGSEMQSASFRFSPSTYAPSSAASSSDAGGLGTIGPFEVPPAPELGPNETEKMCPYCCLVYPSKVFSPHKKSRRWKKHLLEDLQPYICLFRNCGQRGKTYRNFRDWQAHLAQPHDQDWRCPLPHPTSNSTGDEELIFDTEAQFQEHLRLYHSLEASETDIIFRAARQPATLSSRCFVCLAEQSSVVTLQRHLANHLEQAFLLALPNRDDIKDSDAVSSGRPSSDSTLTDTARPRKADDLDLRGLYGDLPVSSEIADNSPNPLSVTEFAARLATIDSRSASVNNLGKPLHAWTHEAAGAQAFIGAEDSRLSSSWRVPLLAIAFLFYLRKRARSLTSAAASADQNSIKPSRPTISRLNWHGKTGTWDISRFDHITAAGASIGHSSIGNIEVDCRFLFNKSKWGVIGHLEKPSGIIYMDISINAPKDSRLQHATIDVTLDDEHPTLERFRVDLPPDKTWSSRLKDLTKTSDLSMTDWYGPKALSFPKRMRVQQSKVLTPEINIPGAGGAGGIGYESERTIKQQHGWTVSSSIVPQSQDSSVQYYRTLRWQVEPDPASYGSFSVIRVHTAFALIHTQQPFLITVDIGGKLGRSLKLSDSLKNAFGSRAKSSESTMTIINPCPDPTQKNSGKCPPVHLDEIAAGLKSEMEMANLESIPTQLSGRGLDYGTAVVESLLKDNVVADFLDEQSGRQRSTIKIGIISLIPSEFDILDLIFDEIWGNDREGFSKYTTGRIGNQNVALARVSNGYPIQYPAEAANMRARYDNIRVTLLVGLCGGVPQVRRGGHQPEILLGDVVLGELTKVFKHLEKSNITLKWLQEMTEEILAGLQMRLKQEPIPIRIEPFAYPGADQDKLFEAKYRHKHQGLTVCICGNCRRPTDPVCDEARFVDCEKIGCDESRLISREQLKSDRNEQNRHTTHPPALHVGTISRHIRESPSGEVRDQIAKEEGVIAFDMIAETAKAWRELPSAIDIRGVCSYADGHNNKTTMWQGYASATAASATKAIILNFDSTIEQTDASAE